MVPDLSNMTALVTGATGKLSRVICLRLAAAGADLALQYHANSAAAEELQAAIRAMGRRCVIHAADLTRPEEPGELARRVMADFGRVDVLVNAASVFDRRRLAQTDDRAWQAMMDLHVTAVFRLVRALMANFKDRSGAIVNLADIWGLRPQAAFPAYSVSKAALIALTQVLAQELAPQTTVNAIAPGIIHFADESAAQRERVVDRIPMHRPGTPEEVAELVLQIIANRYITGQTIVVDGGRSLQ